MNTRWWGAVATSAGTHMIVVAAALAWWSIDEELATESRQDELAGEEAVASPAVELTIEVELEAPVDEMPSSGAGPAGSGSALAVEEDVLPVEVDEEVAVVLDEPAKPGGRSEASGGRTDESRPAVASTQAASTQAAKEDASEARTERDAASRREAKEDAREAGGGRAPASGGTAAKEAAREASAQRTAASRRAAESGSAATEAASKPDTVRTPVSGAAPHERATAAKEAAREASAQRTAASQASGNETAARAEEEAIGVTAKSPAPPTPPPTPPPATRLPPVQPTEVARVGRESLSPRASAPVGAGRPAAPPGAASAATPPPPAGEAREAAPAATTPAAVSRVETSAPVATPAAESAPAPSPDSLPPSGPAAPDKSGRGRTGGNGDVWFKFARSSAPDGGGTGVGGTEFIGDRTVTVPRTKRSPTTAERGVGNARGVGASSPAPDGHVSAPDAPIRYDVVASPSPAPVAAEPDEAGVRTTEAPSPAATPPARLRLSWAGEISDAQLEAFAAPAPAVVPARLVARRKARSKRTPAANPAPTPRAPELPAPLPPLDDEFWSGPGESFVGEGSGDRVGTPGEAGADVQRLVLKVDGAGWTELTALDDDVDKGLIAAVSVQRTDLGVWFATVDDAVRAAWRPPPGALALGHVGAVVLTFEIERDGMVRAVSVVRSDVVVELEQAALGAIPQRVPPPPRGFAPLRVQYTFRYGDVTGDTLAPGAG